MTISKWVYLFGSISGWSTAWVLFILLMQARQGWGQALRGWLSAMGDEDYGGNEARSIDQLLDRVPWYRARQRRDR
jgi:hypothetical protein